MEDKKEGRLAINGRLVRKKYTYSPEALARRAERKRRRMSNEVEPCTANVTNNTMNQLQSIKLTKALANSIGAGGDKLNINFAPVTIINSTGPAQPVTDYKFTNFEDQLWNIIENLPPPKLQNLRKFAMRVCLNKFSTVYGTQSKVASYLDLQRTYVNRIKSELEEDELFGSGTINMIPEEGV